MEVECASAMVGVHSVHVHHEDILTNTRRAMVRVMWGADLGCNGCELDFGSKMKFEAHKLFFIFYLETMIIRALH